MIAAPSIALTLLAGVLMSGCASQAQPPRLTMSTPDSHRVQASPGVVRTLLDPRGARPDTNGECWRSLEEAAQSYQGFAYHRVIRCAEQILGNDQATREEMIVATTLAGASAFLLNDRKLAEGYFLEALGLQPNLRLNPNIYSTSIVQFFLNVKGGR